MIRPKPRPKNALDTRIKVKFDKKYGIIPPIVNINAAKSTKVLYLTDFPAMLPPIMATGIETREGIVETNKRVLNPTWGKAAPIAAMAGVIVPTPIAIKANEKMANNTRDCFFSLILTILSSKSYNGS